MSSGSSGGGTPRDERFATPRSGPNPSLSCKSFDTKSEDWHTPRYPLRRTSSTSRESTDGLEYETYSARSASSNGDSSPADSYSHVEDKSHYLQQTYRTTTTKPHLASHTEQDEIQLGMMDELREHDIDDIFSYARHGRIEDIENVLKRGMPINIRDEFGSTLLITACQNGNKRVAKLVLRKSADINARNHKGNTPLHYCFQYGYGDTLGQYLISKGADSTIRNNAGKLCWDAHPRLSRASSLQMNIFDRFTRVITSNINSVLKGLEDPEKVLDQAVNDMQNDLVKVRQSYAEISATLKRMQKQKDAADGLAADWYKRAELALQKGDEELAREALARRQVQLEISGNLEKQLNMQQNNIDKLYNSMTALDSKINEAKREKDAIIARARTAKTSVQVNDMLNSMTSVTSSNSMEAFNRMKEKVENLEAQAEIAGELAANSAGTSVSMEQRFKALEAGTAMDDELERMKRQLPSPSRSRSNNAPPSPPVSDIMRNLPPMEKAKLDDEYEKLRRELRGR